MIPKIIGQGAEAIITKSGDEIVKQRIEKRYRIKEIDEKIRKLRTRSEARILERASKIIPVPRVIKTDEAKKEIVMGEIRGKKLSDYLGKFSPEEQEQICETMGDNIAKLHLNSIIHGDLTPANMILVENEDKVYFVDFGLGFISSKSEDKAVDLHLLKESFEAGFSERWEKLFDYVKRGYSKSYPDYEKVLERLKAVEKRGRYKQSS